MCVDCVLASSRIAQVDPGDEPLSEVVLAQKELGLCPNSDPTHLCSNSVKIT
jgi:hypothetical protein